MFGYFEASRRSCSKLLFVCCLVVVADVVDSVVVVVDVDVVVVVCCCCRCRC